jgi:tetratricopeptide (TPR) repeat protein
MNRRNALCLSLIAVLSVAASLRAEPIKQHPDNPHYFLYEGQPTILITSAEHYGAVINKDFDYVAYLDALHAYGLNYTRIYPGYLIEPRNKFIAGNTLAPTPDGLILPWARSDKSGYRLGGNLFDLDHWDPAFFARLKDFVAKAAERGVVVEVCLFNAQYKDTWPLSPLSHENNIQGVGDCDFKDAQTLKHADLVKRIEAYVREITTAVNPFDNVILEICDEPYYTGTPPELAGQWIANSLKVIHETESGLPKKHLVAQQVEGLNGPCDFADDPRISLITAQYIWNADGDQVGGMRMLELKYGCNKPIELNETAYFPIWYKGDKVADSRVEAWEFVVGGGAGFNQLNGRFTAADPAGDTPDNQQVLASFRNLKEFMASFDFLKMKPDLSMVKSEIPANTYCRGMSEPGKQYAIYLHHSIRPNPLAADTKLQQYRVLPGEYQHDFVLHLPVGAYQVEWIEPASGKVIRTDRLTSQDDDQTLATPTYAIDFALRIKRSGEGSGSVAPAGAWRAESGYDEAIANCNEALRLDPKNALNYIARGKAWDAKGDFDKAIADYNQAVQVEPKDALIYYVRANVWAGKCEYDKAIADYLEALRLAPKDPLAYVSFAWLCATCADEKWRNGKQAVELATRACELSRWKDEACLGALAAAHAESGSFEDAVKWQSKALEMATEKNKARYEWFLDLYKSGKPYHKAPKESRSMPP